jgi:hypothetical protein
MREAGVAGAAGDLAAPVRVLGPHAPWPAPSATPTARRRYAPPRWVLSAGQTPKQPVYVVDIDVSTSVSLGLAQVNKAFEKAGLRAPMKAAAGDAGYWTTEVDSVSLNDDEEPWVLGDAEIYSIVSGFGLDGNVRVDTVTMPYPDDDHTTYYPNQILVIAQSSSGRVNGARGNGWMTVSPYFVQQF